MGKIDLNKILEVGILLSAEKDFNKLLSAVIDTAMDITGSDAGTLYLYHEGRLEFMILKNHSLDINLGSRGEVVDLPPVRMTEENVCAFSALKKEMFNIPDVYNDPRFDFSGPKTYDKLTGYHSQSMLVYPLENHEGHLVGVVQLINATDETGSIIPFDESFNKILRAIGSEAAVALSNMTYLTEIKDLLMSMAKVFTNAIDARTPYNYYHSRNVHDFVKIYIEFINKAYVRGETTHFFDEDTSEQLLLAALLHDIGKMVIPGEVINKMTRLGSRLEILLNRFEYLMALHHIDYLEGRLNERQFTESKNFLLDAKEQISRINAAAYVTDQDISYLEKVSGKNYQSADGSFTPYLTANEKECLMIRTGTLTAGERNIMRTHVEFTEKFLNNISYNTHYCNIRLWASGHHEFLNGTGYPRGLTAKDIPYETRILVIADIYEALICNDRPYKKSKTPEEAFAILGQMSADGQLDSDILYFFQKAIMECREKDTDCEVNVP